MNYPHLFRVQNDNGHDTYVVIIAHSCYTYEDPWFIGVHNQDPDLPEEKVMIPSIDIEKARHVFFGQDAEINALHFIKTWWVNQSYETSGGSTS